MTVSTRNGKRRRFRPKQIVPVSDEARAIIAEA